MKKITLLLFTFFCFWQINAQVLSESFDGAAFPPMGWTNTQDSGTGIWNRSTTGTNPTCTPHSGAAMARFDSYNFDSGTAAVLSSPVIDLSSGNSYRATFWMYRDSGYPTNTDKVEVFMSTTQNLIGAISLGIINRSSSLAPVVTSDGWYQYSFVIPSTFDTATNYVIFKATSDFGNRIFLDDVVVELIPQVAPNCVAITSPVNGAINVSNPTFTWATSVDATGYYINVGTTPGGTDVANGDDMGTATSFTVPEAEPGTIYYATVSPYNANGIAIGCIESSFTTCDAFAVPFTEGFNSTSATEGCWSVINTNGDSDSWNMGYAVTPIEGDQSAMIYTDGNGGANNDYLISPRITLNGNQRLIFKYKVQSSFEPNDFAVLLSTTGNTAADFTTTLSPLTSYSNTTTETKVIPLSGVTGDVYFAWHVPAGGLDGWRLYIDEVVVEDIPAVAPSCVNITSPVNAAVNVVNSRVTWVSEINATGYKLSVGTTPAGTDVLNMQDVGNVLTYAFTADPATTYHVTVYPYNSTGQATGCSEISFTTCDALTPDVLEQFSTFLPSCWQEADGGNITTGPVTFGSGAWVEDGFANSGSNGAIKVNIDYLNDNGWVISPVVNIPTAGYELKFDAAVTQWNGTGAPTTPWEADDFVQVLVSAGTTNWTVLYTYNNTNVPSNTGTPNIIDLDSYAGQTVRFAFRGVEGSTDGGADVDFFIDNFNVRLTPATVPLCTTNVIATPNATCGNFANLITWEASTGVNGYRINIGTSTGGTEVVNNVDLGNVLSYSFTGNISTVYYYTIIPYNAVGSATGCTEQSFTTNANGCYCVSAPTSVDGSGITNVQLGATNFANTVAAAPVYNDHTATVVDMSQGINNNVQITFNTINFGTSYNYNTVIWIDFNDNFTLEANEIVYTGLSAVASPTILNASFVMPGTAPLGQHRMRIVATDSAFDAPNSLNPCYSGTYGETADFTVNVVAASCTPPSAQATIVPVCGTAQFTVDVNVTALGSGTPSISDGTTTWPLSAIGVVNVGPFASGSSVTLTLLHGSDATCNLSLGSLSYTCPPSNDDCANAISVLNMPYNNSQNASAATGPVVSTCTGMNDGVWYTVVGNGSNIIIDVTAVTGWDPELGVYNGSCGNFTCVASIDNGGTSAGETYTIVASTLGTTYYINVGHYSSFGDSPEGPFTISVTTTLSSDSFNNANFSAYPNPVKDVLNISYTSEISSVRVINMIGQEVLSKNINATSSQVDMSQLSAGTYIINVTVGDAIKTLKVVKQ